MTLEISDCTSTSIDFDEKRDHIDPISRIPKGLAAIPDSIELPPMAPKPNLPRRFLISIALLFVHMVTWTIQFGNWILKNFFGYSSRQKVLYRELQEVATRGGQEEIEGFLTENSSQESAAGFLFGEFVALPETFMHMDEILKGANVCLTGDRGFFCRRWSEHPDSYRRISSHDYQGEECYAIGHFLFWLDLEGNSRFQFEKSPLKGFFSSINHLIDYLRYRRDNEQQGVTGASAHTEYFCLKIPVNPDEFINRKLDYD